MGKQKMLMNPETGSVDSEENWLAEMSSWEANENGHTPKQQFDSLAEVVEDENGNWVEVS